MKKVLIILFALMILSSCILNTNTRTINDLMNNAVETLIIDDVEYTLDAFVWRDFMPSDVQDHSMYSVTTLIRLDSLEIPSNIGMVKQYVIQDNSIWDATYIDRIDTLSTYQIERGSSGGPEWPIGTFVDVISIISHIDTFYYLIAKDVKIIMTQ